jgi:hypothetical protein
MIHKSVVPEHKRYPEATARIAHCWEQQAGTQTVAALVTKFIIGP